MRAPDTSVPAAPPFTLDDIATWGYSSVRYGADSLLSEFSPLLLSLGPDTYMRPHPYDGSGGSNIDLTFRHHKASLVAGSIYPATSAYFCSIMNADVGLFIAVNNVNPAAKLAMNGKVSPLPLLHHWSDIAFLQWLSLPSHIAPLRYVLRAEIQNADTLNVMSHILGYDASTHPYWPELPQRPRWPGMVYNVDTRDAQALLGTPNGKGLAWLVAQRRRELGWRCVEWVAIFFTNCEEWEKSNLLFGLGDVNEEKAEE